MPIAIVLFAVFAMTMANATVYTTLGPFARGGGLSEVQVGTIFATSGMLFLFTSSAWGRFADRRGRRPVIVIGLAGTAASLMLLAALFAVPPDAAMPAALFGAILAARALYGLLAGGTQPAATAHAMEAVGPTRRSSGAAWIGAAVGLGSIVGPVGASFVVGRGSSLPLLIAGALATLAALLVLAGAPEVPPVHRPAVESTGGSRNAMWPGCLLAFVFYFGFAALQPTTAFFIQDFFRTDTAGAVERAGIVSAIFAGPAFAIQAFVVRLLPPSPRSLLLAGTTLCLLGIAACLVVSDFPSLLVAFGVAGIGYGLAQPGLVTWALLAVDGHRQAEAAGKIQAAMSAAWIAGPIVGTAVYAVDLRFVFVLAVGALALSLSVLLVAIPRPAPSPARSPSWCRRSGR